MQWMIGKVINLTSPFLMLSLLFFYSFLCLLVTLTAKVEAASKVLAEERASRQVSIRLFGHPENPILP
jgi:hypothetical protein